jgi:hypothetical protein
MLERITKELHLVSQTADSGIANAHMSVKICEEMCNTFQRQCLADEPNGSATNALRETEEALDYIRKSMICQRDWLTSYKARKDTAMTFVRIPFSCFEWALTYFQVFNMVTQQDSAVNVDIAYKTSKDSSSMHSITILTMVFLPGTFVAVSILLAFYTNTVRLHRQRAYFPVTCLGLGRQVILSLLRCFGLSLQLLSP